MRLTGGCAAASGLYPPPPDPGRGATASRPFARRRRLPTRSAILDSICSTDATQSRPYLHPSSVLCNPLGQHAVLPLPQNMCGRRPQSTTPSQQYSSPLFPSFEVWERHRSQTSNVYFNPSTSPSFDQASLVKCRCQSAGKKRSPEKSRWIRVMKSFEQSGKPSA